LFDDFWKVGWLMETEAGQLYHSSDPVCKRQNVRLITCISKVRQIMAQTFENLQTSMNLEMKLLEGSALSIEKIQLLSHLKKDTDFQFEVISHLAKTLTHIGFSMKTLDEEKVSVIESFLANFWGMSSPQPEDPKSPAPSDSHPASTVPATPDSSFATSDPSGCDPSETSSCQSLKTSDETSTDSAAPQEAKKSNPISEDELNDRYQELIRTHQIDFSQPKIQTQPRFAPPTGQLRSSSSFSGPNPYAMERNFLTHNPQINYQPQNQHTLFPNPYLLPNQQPRSQQMLHPQPTPQSTQPQQMQPGFRLPSTQKPNRSFF